MLRFLVMELKEAIMAGVRTLRASMHKDEAEGLERACNKILDFSLSCQINEVFYNRKRIVIMWFSF